MKFDVLRSDLRHTFRLIRKSPLFALVAVGTLALGIGANVTMFSLVEAVLIRALPYDEPDRVVMVWEDATRAGFPRNTPAPGNFNDWRRLNRSFVDVSASRGLSASVTGDGPPEQLFGRGVTPSFFTVLGVQPFLGRALTDEEERTGAPVVVISHALWLRRYAGDPGIIGRTIAMNDQKHQIIGVMPRGFVFRDRTTDYWAPLNLPPRQIDTRDSHFLHVIARLRPAVTFEMAEADMRSVVRTMTEKTPYPGGHPPVVLVPIAEEAIGTARVQLLVLVAAAASILLIGCANLASLLLSRAAGRRGELAIRAALGATRGRLVRQMLVEGTVLSLVGGLVALAVPLLTRAAVQQLVPVGVSGLEPSVLAWRLLAVTFAISVGTGLLFSLIPALHAARASMRDALQQNIRASVGGSSGRTRDALVVLQVAAALVLLVGAGLMLRTLANLRAIDLGFRSERLLTMRTTLPQPKYGDPAKRVAFFDRVIAEVRRLPGVQRAAYASTLPFMAAGNTRAFSIEGRPQVPGEIRDALFRVGTSEYLQTLGVQLIAGRLIDERDVADAPLVVVINETMARMYWSDTSALERRIAFGPPGSQPVTIVGVVKDVRERGYELDMKPGVYVPATQMQTFVPSNLILRVAGEPAGYIRQVERIIAGIDPDQPITFVRTMDDIIDTTVADRRQQMILLVAFGGVALLLVSLGLYGLLAQAVAGRSREIGLRMALGATRGLVMTMIVRRGLALTAGGITIGAAVAWGMTRLMQSLLYGVGATDPVTFAAVVALLAVVAIGACALPALRASRVDPMLVLREE